MSGKVFLVGAGPGDPGLITRRGSDLIATADVIVVDDLVNPELLQSIPSQKIIYVGKRGPGSPIGSFHQRPQKGINRLLIQLAKKHERVVRLKGGDPFLFGRGGEEMLALKRAHVSFEIVPGVTSALAAPAFAGIPVTDRDFSSQVTIVTGHEREETEGARAGVDWKNISKHGTLVILMGVKRWPWIQEKLLKNGWPLSTPVAAIESGTTARQRDLVTTLKDAASKFKKMKLMSPAIIIVGDVVTFGRTCAWFQTEKPLLGKRIVVTRAAGQSKDLIARLNDLGAQVIHCPAIRIVPLWGSPLVQRLLADLKRSPTAYDWIVFASANAVRTFARLFQDESLNLKRISFCAVGPETAKEISRHGWTVKKIANDYNSRGILDVLTQVKGKRILIPRVQGGSPDLVDGLRGKGALVDEIAVYETRSATPPTKIQRAEILRGVDAITFTSASTAKYFFKFFSEKEQRIIAKQSTAISIGSLTTRALKELGVKKILEPKKSTTSAMVETLVQHQRKS